MDYPVDASTSRQREQIIVDDFGVDLALSDLSDFDAVQAAFLDAIRAKNRSSWTIGDLYLATVEQGGLGEQVAQFLDAASFSLKTAQNYAAVCAVWVKQWRVVPVSLSHYEAAAKLARTRPTDALKLLEQAHDHQLTREWVREQAALLLGETDTSIEVLLTWDAVHGVFVPNISLNLPAGISRTIRIKQVA